MPSRPGVRERLGSLADLPPISSPTWLPDIFLFPDKKHKKQRTFGLPKEGEACAPATRTGAFCTARLSQEAPGDRRRE